MRAKGFEINNKKKNLEHKHKLNKNKSNSLNQKKKKSKISTLYKSIVMLSIIKV
jgi:hypothetical protein